jgi:hypothetical protein
LAILGYFWLWLFLGLFLRFLAILVAFGFFWPFWAITVVWAILVGFGLGFCSILAILDYFGRFEIFWLWWFFFVFAVFAISAILVFFLFWATLSKKVRAE